METELLNIVRYNLNDSQYYKTKTQKKQIYIHHTAGAHDPFVTARNWNNDDRGHIATAYIVGGKSTRSGDTKHDGVVCQCFDDEYWGFHLGVKGSNGVLDKASIGIEICNYGWLRRDPVTGEYFTYVNTLVPASDVCDLGEKFKGYRYYHKYTDNQISAVRELILHLTQKYGIPIKSGLVSDIGSFGGMKAFEYNVNALKGMSGVWTHTNVRKDKSDCSPQLGLINMLNDL